MWPQHDETFWWKCDDWCLIASSLFRYRWTLSYFQLGRQTASDKPLQMKYKKISFIDTYLELRINCTAVALKLTLEWKQNIHMDNIKNQYSIYLSNVIYSAMLKMGLKCWFAEQIAPRNLWEWNGWWRTTFGCLVSILAKLISEFLCKSVRGKSHYY